jgi:hypothetical protein
MESRRDADMSASEISDVIDSVVTEAEAAFGPPEAWPDELVASVEAARVNLKAIVARIEDVVVRAHNLERALDSNRQIGVAIGILVAQHKISQGAAFELMRVASQRQHRKLSLVAEDVVLFGTVIDVDRRP